MLVDHESNTIGYYITKYGDTSSPVRISLLVLQSTMRKALDLALREAPAFSRGCVVVGGTSCWFWGLRCCLGFFLLLLRLLWVVING